MTQSEKLHQIMEMARQSEDVKMMTKIIADAHGSLAQCIEDAPEMFDLLYEECQSIFEMMQAETERHE